MRDLPAPKHKTYEDVVCQNKNQNGKQSQITLKTTKTRIKHQKPERYYEPELNENNQKDSTNQNQMKTRNREQQRRKEEDQEKETSNYNIFIPKASCLISGP